MIPAAILAEQARTARRNEDNMNQVKSEPVTLGFAITGSFCTYQKILETLQNMKTKNYNIIPIFSEKGGSLDTRFQKADDFVSKVQEITGNEGIFTIPDAEPIGPKGYLDALVIAPCTGNTLAKLCHGITDSTVLMAAKAHLRNEKPLIISISTNDALGMNFKNLGQLMNTKNIYFVPFGQDNYKKKNKFHGCPCRINPRNDRSCADGKTAPARYPVPFLNRPITIHLCRRRPWGNIAYCTGQEGMPVHSLLFYFIGNCSLCGGRQQEFSQKILARAQAKSVPFFIY